MVNLSNKFIELRILFSGLYTVWEDTDGFAKQYRCSLGIYLMTVISYLYRIIMDHAINATGHVKNLVDGLNTNY